MTKIQENEIKTTADNTAMTAAHHDFEKGLNSYAFFKLHDKQDGQDLVQTTFLKTWTYLVKGGQIDMMKAFLYHILNNLIVDTYRKRNHETSSLDSLLEDGFEPGTSDTERVYNILDGKGATLLIARLPETYREVMTMRYVRDLSLKEISLIVGRSRNSVAVQVHRGLQKLKVLYKPAYQ